ncbi:autophagy-related protein 2 homolog A-like [Hirundo rustica]|uniref:autophagy-related protein 2 homolog A-like n=1 Tax=Hirundo rustica TaxID=43150 RepID=UPI002673E71F|nr:autophagy-related protein 2 homolog A-like [Hirundo rustica]
MACDHLEVMYEAEDMGTLPCLRVEPGPGPGGPRSVPTLEVTVAEAPPQRPPATPPTPFSARRSIYESRELVLPGTPEELGAFMGEALGGAPWTLQVTLPRAHLSLSPPELLQRLYNRINNDLLLWDPAGPAPCQGPAPSADPVPAGDPAPSEGHAPFRPCRSALGTDSEEEEEEDEGPGVSPQDLGDTRDPPGPPQSGGAVLVTVPWGRVTADCPAAGGVPGSRLVLELGEGRLCVLPRPGGAQGLSRACADARSLVLLHGPVPDEGEGPPPPLHPTLVPWEEPAPPPGVPAPPRMLALALGSSLSPRGDTKELVVAVALEGVMLRHRPDPPGTPWYSQLLALLALEDEPVLGYTAPTPLTQLHLHLQRCSLDYRPPPLPLRVLVTAETLSVTCGSGPDPRPGGLRLLVDDGSVFLSERCGGGALDLQRDFVSVLDVDFLELVLNTWRGGDGEGGGGEWGRGPPPEELLVAPARLRGRTCADSAAAIARLLRHLGTPPGPPPGAPDSHAPAPGPPVPPERPSGQPEPPPGAEQSPPVPPPAPINQQDLTDALRDPPGTPPGDLRTPG